MRQKHLFITQDYPPDLGGMARRHVELCRRFGDDKREIQVSTVASALAPVFDATEPYRINRQPFSFSGAKVFANQLRWAKWLLAAPQRDVRMLHCGNVRPVGYAVAITHLLRGTPYMLYVNGSDVLREQQALGDLRRRASAHKIFSGASGVVGTSQWVSDITNDLMDSLEIRRRPPVGSFGLGTDPEFFHPRRTCGRLRAVWGVGTNPIVITVARLVPHKGQDIALHAVAALREEFPALRYVIVGTGPDEPRLRALAEKLGMTERTIFAGAVADNDLAEAYATATLYVGLSRVDQIVFAEGFGIAFLEAAASGLASVAGDSGGVRSAVHDGETGIIVPPTDIGRAADAIRTLLRDDAKRARMGAAGRRLVEVDYNWDRVAADTRAFTHGIMGF